MQAFDPNAAAARSAHAVGRDGRSGDLTIPVGGVEASGIGKHLGRAAFAAGQRHESALPDAA